MNSFRCRWNRRDMPNQEHANALGVNCLCCPRRCGSTGHSLACCPRRSASVTTSTPCWQWSVARRPCPTTWTSTHLKLANKLLNNKWDGALLPIDNIDVDVMPGRAGRFSAPAPTPRLSASHSIKGKARTQAQCVVCTATNPQPKPGEPRLSRTQFWCPECDVALHRECFARFHAPGGIPGLDDKKKAEQRALMRLTERSADGRKWVARRTTRAQAPAVPTRR
eukprot:jgi/Mesvir1/24205/Mv25240-RA.1